MQRLPLDLPPGPVHLATTTTHVVVSHALGVVLFNATSSWKKGLRPLLSHSWRDIWAQYDLSQYAAASTDAGVSKASNVNPNAAELGTNDASTGGQKDGTPFANEDFNAALESILWTPTAVGSNKARLVVLPLARHRVAFFVQEHQGGGRGRGYNPGGSSSSSNADWFKVVQPFVVVVMIGAAVWQFMRASRQGGSYSGMSRHSGMGGISLGGDMAGQGGLGDFGGLGGVAGFGYGASRSAARRVVNRRSAFGAGSRLNGGGAVGPKAPAMSDAEFSERLANIDEQLGYRTHDPRQVDQED